jgi:endonuclease-3
VDVSARKKTGAGAAAKEGRKGKKRSRGGASGKKAVKKAGRKRESREARRERAAEIASRLADEYPGTDITLDWSNPLELLVSTILSAQCTDERVREVTKPLFKEYRSAADYAEADRSDLEEAIRSTGFYRNKARHIQEAARKICEEHGGKVPDTMEELLTLPGVARKTANVVLSNAFGKNEGIVVDTHVKRVSRRLGLASSADPEKIERSLMEVVPRGQWRTFAWRLILHGRTVCHGRKAPECDRCVLSDLCPSAFSFG